MIGTVGAGKSSLLSAIMAEMQREQGLVTVANIDDGFGLAAQEPWIQNASIKDNILFGKPFCEEKYTAVLDACALEEDLKVDVEAYLNIVYAWLVMIRCITLKSYTVRSLLLLPILGQLSMDGTVGMRSCCKKKLTEKNNAIYTLFVTY